MISYFSSSRRCCVALSCGFLGLAESTWALADARDECRTVASSPYEPGNSGKGVVAFEKIDSQLAYDACNEAALSKNATAADEFRYARVLQRRGSMGEALVWYKKAADRGYAPAMNNLGVLYNSREGVPVSYELTFAWIKKASDQGYAPAQSNLGLLYQIGLGTGRDYALAMELFRKAADQGYAPAQNNLGLAYERMTNHLKHREGDSDLHHLRLHNASSGIHPDRTDSKGLLLDGTIPRSNVDYKPSNVPRTLGVEWIRKAAEQGYASAQANLGFLHKRGRRVPSNPTLAVEWYRKAADQGDILAQIDLGTMYYNGEGVSKNDALAFEWFKKAADQGNSVGQYNLGVMYYAGAGVSKSEASARHWWQKAADQGLERARLALKPDDSGSTPSSRPASGLGPSAGEIAVGIGALILLGTALSNSSSAPADSKAAKRCRQVQRIAGYYQHDAWGGDRCEAGAERPSGSGYCYKWVEVCE